jgi:hypothetical protein
MWRCGLNSSQSINLCNPLTGSCEYRYDHLVPEKVKNFLSNCATIWLSKDPISCRVSECGNLEVPATVYHNITYHQNNLLYQMLLTTVSRPVPGPRSLPSSGYREFSLDIKRPYREGDHWNPSSGYVRNMRIYASILPISLHDVVLN